MFSSYTICKRNGHLRSFSFILIVFLSPARDKFHSEILDHSFWRVILFPVLISEAKTLIYCSFSVRYNNITNAYVQLVKTKLQSKISIYICNICNCDSTVLFLIVNYNMCIETSLDLKLDFLGKLCLLFFLFFFFFFFFFLMKNVALL